MKRFGLPAPPWNAPPAMRRIRYAVMYAIMLGTLLTALPARAEEYTIAGVKFSLTLSAGWQVDTHHGLLKDPEIMHFEFDPEHSDYPLATVRVLPATTELSEKDLFRPLNLDAYTNKIVVISDVEVLQAGLPARRVDFVVHDGVDRGFQDAKDDSSTAYIYSAIAIKPGDNEPILLLTIWYSNVTMRNCDGCDRDRVQQLQRYQQIHQGIDALLASFRAGGEPPPPAKKRRSSTAHKGK